jgi:hypothetical protein
MERDFGDDPALADLVDPSTAGDLLKDADLFFGLVSFALHDLVSFLKAPD